MHHLLTPDDCVCVCPLQVPLGAARPYPQLLTSGTRLCSSSINQSDSPAVPPHCSFQVCTEAASCYCVILLFMFLVNAPPFFFLVRATLWGCVAGSLFLSSSLSGSFYFFSLFLIHSKNVNFLYTMWGLCVKKKNYIYKRNIMRVPWLSMPLLITLIFYFKLSRLLFLCVEYEKKSLCMCSKRRETSLLGRPMSTSTHLTSWLMSSVCFCFFTHWQHWMVSAADGIHRTELGSCKDGFSSCISFELLLLCFYPTLIKVPKLVLPLCS